MRDNERERSSLGQGGNSDASFTAQTLAERVFVKKEVGCDTDAARETDK